MDASELDYDLPPELVAQHPAALRDASRLLVYERATGDVRHRSFGELPQELSSELTVVNDTRVVPARIRIDRPKGEVLLLEHEGGGEWLALARPTRRLKAGARYGAVELVERHARVDDLALLVDLVSSGWKGVDDRLQNVERATVGATVHPLRDAG